MGRRPQFGRIFKRKKRLSDGNVVELGPWWIEYYANGRQVRESSRSERLRDAENLLKNRQLELHTGTFAGETADRITVGQLLDDLKLDFEINGKSVAWLSYVDGHLRPFFGQLRASRVTTNHIQQYIAKRRAQGIANGTINRELGRLRRAFNLGREATPPKVTRVPKIPNLEENNVRKGFFEHENFSAMRNELPDHLKPVITFAYETGCRKGEILALRWNQVDLRRGIIRLEPGETKNDEGRTIPLMTDELKSMLVEQKRFRDEFWPDCPFVFFRYGKQIKNFYGAWQEAAKRAGLATEDSGARKLFHDLRRTGVRNMIRAGVPERVAMAISGHKTRSMLDRYNIISEGDLRHAAERVRQYLAARQSGADKDTLRTPGRKTKTASKVEAAK